MIDTINPSEAQSSQADVLAKRKKIGGILKGKITIADDFNETPDCFKELCGNNETDKLINQR